MCYNGLISFELAAAMVLGENIGTTITANIAAVVANVSAKRTARAHLIFNLFGVIWMLIVFRYFLLGIDLIMLQYHGISILNTHLSQTDYEIVKNEYPVALAIFHTSFNVINTLVLIGFAPLIAKAAIKMVPDKGEDDEEFRLMYINTGLFSTSEIAIIQAQKEIMTFGRRIERMLTFAEALLKEDKSKKYYKLLSKIEKYEQITDNLELEIADFLTKVSEGELSHESSKKIRALLKIIDDMESVGDTIYQLSKVMDNAKKSQVVFNENQLDALRQMFDLLKKAFEEMNLNLGKNYDSVNIDKAEAIETTINNKRNAFRLQHVEDLKEKKYKHKVGTFYIDMVSICERVGDYLINVSEAIDEYQDA